MADRIVIVGDLALDRIYTTSDCQTYRTLSESINYGRMNEFFKVAHQSRNVQTANVLGGPALNIAQYFSQESVSADCISIVGIDAHATELKSNLQKLLGEDHVHLQIRATEGHNLTPECIYFFGPDLKEARPFWRGHVSEAYFNVPAKFLEYGNHLIVSSLRKAVALKFIDSSRDQRVYFNPGLEIFNLRNRYNLTSLDSALSKTNVLFGNDAEIDEITKIYGSSLSEILSRHPSLEMIFTTRGKVGASVVYKQGIKVRTKSIILANPPKGLEIVPDERVVDRVGAGDAFLAGSVLAIISGSEPFDCLIKGTELAQKSLLHRGGFNLANANKSSGP